MALQTASNSLTATNAEIFLGTTDDLLFFAGVNRVDTDGNGLSATGNAHSVTLLGTLAGFTNGMIFLRPAAPADHLISVLIGANGYLASYGSGVNDAALLLQVAPNDNDVNEHAITNLGTIYSTAQGIRIETIATGGENVNVTNTGLIETLGTAIVLFGVGSCMSLVNSGTIITHGLTAIEGAATNSSSTVINTGTIDGSINFATTTGIVLIDNSGGRIIGDITFGSGNDIFRPGLQQIGAVSGGSGSDLIDFSQFSSGVVFALDRTLPVNQTSLNFLPFSFEKLDGTVFNDFLRGNSVDNNMTGNSGNDTLEGMSGNDTLDGGPGNDVLRGGDSGDFLFDGQGVNVVDGGAGGDTYIAIVDSGTTSQNTVQGGEGFDTATIESSVAVTYDMQNLPGNTVLMDTYAGIEKFILRSFGPGFTFLADAASTVFELTGGGLIVVNGRDGNDTFVPLNDVPVVVIDGGNGTDTLDLTDSDFNNGVFSLDGALLPSAALDTITAANVENLVMGTGNFIGRGNTLNNTLIDSGNDILADIFHGGAAGNDTVSYERGTNVNGVNTSLDGSLPSSAEATGDTYTAIDNLTGSNFVDGLAGDINANILRGLGGADILSGNSGNDTLIGGAGGDNLIGGTGLDTATYSAAVKVFMLNMGANTGEALGDIFNGIENLTGSAGNDQLEGDNLAAGNLIFGAAGIDLLKGNGGNDTLRGGTGLDTMFGGAGVDRFQFMALAEAGDKVMDFGVSDFIVVKKTAFTGLIAGASVNAAQFIVRADNNAQDGNDRFIFRTTDDTLWYDSNGNAAGGTKILVADLNIAFNLAAGDILQV